MTKLTAEHLETRELERTCANCGQRDVNGWCLQPFKCLKNPDNHPILDQGLRDEFKARGGGDDEAR